MPPGAPVVLSPQGVRSRNDTLALHTPPVPATGGHALAAGRVGGGEAWVALPVPAQWAQLTVGAKEARPGAGVAVDGSPGPSRGPHLRADRPMAQSLGDPIMSPGRRTEEGVPW
jgi:hypothetical protein